MKQVIQIVVVLVGMFFFSTAMAADQVAVIPLWTTKDLKNVVTVSQKGGDFTDPVAAINSIGDAGANNPYLLVIGPGVYTLAETLVMKEYVVITGAGEKATILSGAISSASSGVSASLVAGASNASLRWLTLKNTGGGAYSYGIYNESTSPIIQNVTVDISGGTSRNVGIYSTNSTSVIQDSAVLVSGGFDNYAIFNVSNGNSEIINVSLTSSNGSNNNWGVYNELSVPVIQDITVNCSGGVYTVGVYNYNSSSSPVNLYATSKGASVGNYGLYSYNTTYKTFKIQRSTMDAVTPGAGLYIYGGTVYVSQSTIIGGVGGSGTKTCVASDNGTGGVLLLTGCN